MVLSSLKQYYKVFIDTSGHGGKYRRSIFYLENSILVNYFAKIFVARFNKYKTNMDFFPYCFTTRVYHIKFVRLYANLLRVNDNWSSMIVWMKITNSLSNPLEKIAVYTLVCCKQVLLTWCERQREHVNCWYLTDLYPSNQPTTWFPLLPTPRSLRYPLPPIILSSSWFLSTLYTVNFPSHPVILILHLSPSTPILLRTPRLLYVTRPSSI